jgi:hypothetical protein
MADGARVLAMTWDAAWRAGEGERNITRSKLVQVPTGALQDLYDNPDFVPSLDLDSIGPVLEST